MAANLAVPPRRLHSARGLTVAPSLAPPSQTAATTMQPTARITSEHVSSPSFQGQAVRAVGRLVGVDADAITLQLAGPEGGARGCRARADIPHAARQRRRAPVAATPCAPLPEPCGCLPTPTPRLSPPARSAADDGTLPVRRSQVRARDGRQGLLRGRRHAAERHHHRDDLRVHGRQL
jgi:hypothetical protein